MKAKEVILPGITGTTFMTLFSKAMSLIEKENFSEPDLLAKLFHGVAPNASKQQSKAVGWNAHYAIGLLFALVYAELWDLKKIKPSGKTSILLGSISGGVAIAFWKATFKMHAAPPGTHFKKYYRQLFFAHVVFAFFTTLTYYILKEQELENKREERLQSPLNGQ